MRTEGTTPFPKHCFLISLQFVKVKEVKEAKDALRSYRLGTAGKHCTSVLNGHFDKNRHGHRARTFACVLSDVNAKLNGVSGENLAGRALLRAAT